MNSTDLHNRVVLAVLGVMASCGQSTHPNGDSSMDSDIVVDSTREDYQPYLDTVVLDGQVCRQVQAREGPFLSLDHENRPECLPQGLPAGCLEEGIIRTAECWRYFAWVTANGSACMPDGGWPLSLPPNVGTVDFNHELLVLFYHRLVETYVVFPGVEAFECDGRLVVNLYQCQIEGHPWTFSREQYSSIVLPKLDVPMEFHTFTPRDSYRWCLSQGLGCRNQVNCPSVSTAERAVSTCTGCLPRDW